MRDFLAESFLIPQGFNGNQEDRDYCNWGCFWDIGGKFGNTFKLEFTSENYGLVRFCGIVLGRGGGWIATEIFQIFADTILLYNGAWGV